MPPTLTAFATSPDRGRGLARDMRIRWALEEVGQPYDVRLLTFAELKQPAHLALHPFGQIPTFQDGDLSLFESGAIVLYIAQSHPGLLPTDAAAQARAISWMFAALNNIEPPILDRESARFFEAEKPWYADRLALVEARIHTRLAQLSTHLGRADWLDGAFTAADLLMVSVLQRLKSSTLLNAHLALPAYLTRAESRPAFQRAFAAQLAVFTAQTPTDKA